MCDKLIIIRNYVNNDQEFMKRASIPQQKRLDPVYLVLTTTWHASNSQSYQYKDGEGMGAPASTTIVEIYIQAHKKSAVSAALNPQKA